jgi:hypothetical protein
MIPLNPSQFCWICGKAVTAETRAVDEHSSVVHQKCYAAKIALAAAAANAPRKPSLSSAGMERLDVAVGK